MADPIVRPNLHVILIHFPLALLIVGTLIELFSFMWSRSGFRAAGRWMILLGALMAVPATFSGIYALRDVAARNNPTVEGSWVSVKASSPLLSQPMAWHVLERHMQIQSIATGVCVLVVVIFLGCSDEARASLRAAFLAILLIAVGAMVAGAWFGGEAIYRFGAGVDMPGAKAVAGSPPTYGFENYVSPTELHIIAAGMMVAIALAAIGLSFRKISATTEVPDERRPIIPRDSLRGQRPLTPSDPVALLRSFNPGLEMFNDPFAPASRFWLLACALAILTAVGGLFLTFGDVDLFSSSHAHHQPIWQAAWNQIKPMDGRKINRLIAHLIGAALLILTPLVLAGITRFAPRRKFWLTVCTLFLIVVVAAQVWIGVLMLYDTPDGPITHFQTASEAQ